MVVIDHTDRILQEFTEAIADESSQQNAVHCTRKGWKHLNNQQKQQQTELYAIVIMPDFVKGGLSSSFSPLIQLSG